MDICDLSRTAVSGGKHSRYVAPPTGSLYRQLFCVRTVNMDTEEMTGLETKLTQLKMGVDRTEAILNSGKRAAIKRNLEALQTTAKETSECKRVVEAQKITKKEGLEEINAWSDEIDREFEAADEAITTLESGS